MENKVESIFPIVVVSILLHAEFRRNGHRKHAPHFIIYFDQHPEKPLNPIRRHFLFLTLFFKDIKQGGEVQLRRNLPRWTSETAITQGALDSKRDEFWETAPKYEGKKVSHRCEINPKM